MLILHRLPHPPQRLLDQLPRRGDVHAQETLFLCPEGYFLASLPDSVYTRRIGASMSEIDLAPLTPAIEKFIPLGRAGLLPALHAAQKIYGWLPQEVAAEVAKNLK